MVSMNSHFTLCNKNPSTFDNNQKLFFPGTERWCSIAYSWVACCRYVGQPCWTSHCWLQTCGLFWSESLRTMRRSALSMHISLHMVINSLTELYWILIKAVFFLLMARWTGSTSSPSSARRLVSSSTHTSMLPLSCQLLHPDMLAWFCNLLLFLLKLTEVWCTHAGAPRKPRRRRRSPELVTSMAKQAMKRPGCRIRREAPVPASAAARSLTRGSSLTAWEYTYLQRKYVVDDELTEGLGGCRRAVREHSSHWLSRWVEAIKRLDWRSRTESQTGPEAFLAFYYFIQLKKTLIRYNRWRLF